MGKINQKKEKQERNKVYAEKYQSSDKASRKLARKNRLLGRYARLEAIFYSQTLTGPPNR